MEGWSMMPFTSHGEVDLAQMYVDGMYWACPSSVTFLLSKYGDMVFGCKVRLF